MLAGGAQGPRKCGTSCVVGYPSRESPATPCATFGETISERNNDMALARRPMQATARAPRPPHQSRRCPGVRSDRPERASPRGTASPDLDRRPTTDDQPNCPPSDPSSQITAGSRAKPSCRLDNFTLTADAPSPRASSWTAGLSS
jgi:hypothetical protein